MFLGSALGNALIGLRMNNTLKEIDISGNLIGCGGLVNLASVLKVNRSLTKVLCDAQMGT